MFFDSCTLWDVLSNTHLKKGSRSHKGSLLGIKGVSVFFKRRGKKQKRKDCERKWGLYANFDTVFKVGGNYLNYI